MPKLTCLGKGKNNLKNTLAPAFYMEEISKITTISSPM